MAINTHRNVHTFIGCDKEYEESSIVIFGAPFDGTTSYRPGARFAPQTIRGESYSIETYSPYQDKDLADISVFDGGDLELCFGNPERVLGDIERYAARVMDDGKIPVMIGGEHLVTFGAVRAAAKKYDRLRIIHFDAHTDMRDEYLGEKLSHASVMRRCHDLLGEKKIYQFGIRSGEKEEFVFAKEHQFINKFDFHGLKEAMNKLAGEPVYFTIDLDVLDPADFDGTGTPEAGGVRFIELLEAVLEVSRLNVVAVDINELSPPYDHSGKSTSLACKLVREILLSLRAE